jgi:hypothetical protein
VVADAAASAIVGDELHSIQIVTAEAITIGTASKSKSGGKGAREGRAASAGPRP